MDFIFEQRWSPYAVGALIGLINLLGMLISNKPLGASTSFLKLSGMIVGLFDKNRVLSNDYYKKNKPEIDWGMMLVFGIILGAFLSAVISGDFRLMKIPPMWSDNVSSNFIVRFIGALVGGIFLGVGSRWAGGCTSGHGISGTSQLSILSWVAAVSFFVVCIITAFLIYGI